MSQSCMVTWMPDGNLSPLWGSLDSSCSLDETALMMLTDEAVLWLPQTLDGVQPVCP